MNFIDRKRIRSNPNIIETWSHKKITEEVIEYAIDKGFKLNPKKIMKLLESDEDNIYCKFFQKLIKQNIAEFIPYLEKMDELCSQQLIDDEIKQLTILYLKENKICYNDNFPIFAIQDMEYALMCIQLDPNIRVRERQIYIPLEEYPKIIKKIAEKIETEQIWFEEIPLMYMDNKEILEAIIKINPELLKERVVLDVMTREMSEEEELEYYKSIGYPFSAETVIQDKFLIVLECLKNDYMTLADSSVEFTIEQYKQIYDVLKDSIKIEEVLSSSFLTQNPYFIMELLGEKHDLENVDFQREKYYRDLYPRLKAIAIKNGVDIKEPMWYEDVIEFKGNEVFAQLNDLTGVKKGLQYLKESGLSQDLNVVLQQEEFNEFVIADNIEFFEELLKNGININFKYDTGKKVFSLKEILRMEHFMQRIVDDIKSKNFSPLEQLIAVYDISKLFKEYKGGEYIGASRALYEYLDNEYMVCAGYANLIANLGHRLNAAYASIGLELVDKDGKCEGGHARNYANIVDEKYDIDGLYVLDPTWEYSGYRSQEQYKSRYEYFLLTTEEGRNTTNLGFKIDLNIANHGGYDALITMQTPEEIREYFSKKEYYRQKWFERMQQLDPKFYKKMVTLDFSKDEDANILIHYFQSKVNNSVPKEKLLEAIITVKKSIYLNFTEQDFEDMRMGYSITKPFCIMNEEGEEVSLYGEKYNEYIKRRYENIKLQFVDQAKKDNTCLDIKEILSRKKIEILRSKSIFGKVSSDETIEITDEGFIQLIQQNEDLIEECGFVYEEIDYEEEYGISGRGTKRYLSNIYDFDDDLTIQKNMEEYRARVERLCQILKDSKEVNNLKSIKENEDDTER